MLVFDVFPLNSEFLGSLSSRFSPSLVSVLDVLVVGGVGDGVGVGEGVGEGVSMEVGALVFGEKFA